MQKSGGKHTTKQDKDAEDDSESMDTASSSESENDEPQSVGPVYYWSVEGPDEFLLFLHEWPGLTSDVVPLDTGLRVEWSVEEPSDSVLAKFHAPICEAHKSMKLNTGSFFVQAPRSIHTAAPLVRSNKDREWKVIYAAWKDSPSGAPFKL